jgi:uncharacterized protein (DUF427 family)
VSLTYGTGPLGQRPAGRFNRDLPREGVLYVEELPRWVRVRFADETVADSRRPRLVHEHGRLPVLHFPEEDVRTDLLRPTGHTESDEVKGERERFTVAGDGRAAEGAAWRYREGLLAGLYGFDWDAMDEWLEEDEQLVGHPRDPYSRIDVRKTTRHVRVSTDGEVLAESRRTKVLYEAGLPPRWYFPREDVRMDLLETSDGRTTCAYKGHASYWNVRVGDRVEDDLVWTYREPLHDAMPVKDMLAFFNERVEIEVDGEPEERPHTQWSRD